MKNGPKILFLATLICIAVYIGIFIGRTSSQSITYLPGITEIDKKQSIRINLNRATADELAEIPGISSVLARAIVQYRNEYGDYVDIDELLDVRGMSDAVYEQIKEYVTIGGS